LIDGWALAWRVDATEARLAVGLSLTAALVLALAFVLVVRFYFFEDGMRSTSIAILLPGLGALYAAVVGTAVPGFADRLARASGRSEARFREYWESIARGAADR
ncbi:MAG TPA: hypothetical protein VIV06_01060, partial [Candidatus Limnocylindrales bacterium]